MGEHEAAAIQIGSILISSGAAVTVLKWLVPYIIQLYFDKKQETIAAERKNTAMAVELEELRRKNADLQLAHLDEVVKLHTTQMLGMGNQLASFCGQVAELKSALSHTDGELAKMIPYMPTLERISEWLKKMDDKAKHSSPAPAQAPATGKKTEQVPIGKDSVLVRDKKGGG